MSDEKTGINLEQDLVAYAPVDAVMPDPEKTRSSTSTTNPTNPGTSGGAPDYKAIQGLFSDATINISRDVWKQLAGTTISKFAGLRDPKIINLFLGLGHSAVSMGIAEYVNGVMESNKGNTAGAQLQAVASEGVQKGLSSLASMMGNVYVLTSPYSSDYQKDMAAQRFGDSVYSLGFTENSQAAAATAANAGNSIALLQTPFVQGFGTMATLAAAAGNGGSSAMEDFMNRFQMMAYVGMASEKQSNIMKAKKELYGDEYGPEGDYETDFKADASVLESFAYTQSELMGKPQTPK